MLQNVSSSWEAEIAAVILDNCPDTTINCQTFCKSRLKQEYTIWYFLRFWAEAKSSHPVRPFYPVSTMSIMKSITSYS